MNNCFVVLNPSKTKILVVMTTSLRNVVVIQGTSIDNNCVRFIKSVKNLGIILDNELSFAYQIQKVVKSCFLLIRKLSKIKDYLTYVQLQTVICACILSQQDYCNSLYFGVNADLLNKLQSVQNSAARIQE